MKYLFTLCATVKAIKINEQLSVSSLSQAEVTKMTLNSNPDFVGYLIQNGEEVPVDSLAEVDSQYRFNSSGDVIGTSFLSLDLLTIA